LLPTIDPTCFEIRDRTLPGREMAELNELCWAIVEALRQPRPPVLVEVRPCNVVRLRPS
jgi:hypothetical protein